MRNWPGWGDKPAAMRRVHRAATFWPLAHFRLMLKTLVPVTATFGSLFVIVAAYIACL